MTAEREALVKARDALQAMMDTWFDYHDAHSLTRPVTGASENAFERALAARDTIDQALANPATGDDAECRELRKIIAGLGYCTADASLEFMRLIPGEVQAERARLASATPAEPRYKTSGESTKQPRVSTDRLPDNYHERDCEYVVSDDPAPCTCGYYDREQAAIAALSEPPSLCGESRPTNSAGRPEARKSAATPAEPDER